MPREVLRARLGGPGITQMPPAVACTNSPLGFAGSQGCCRHQHLDVVTGGNRTGLHVRRKHGEHTAWLVETRGKLAGLNEALPQDGNGTMDVCGVGREWGLGALGVAGIAFGPTAPTRLGDRVLFLPQGWGKLARHSPRPDLANHLQLPPHTSGTPPVSRSIEWEVRPIEAPSLSRSHRSPKTENLQSICLSNRCSP